jgi:hypothetical protein
VVGALSEAPARACWARVTGGPVVVEASATTPTVGGDCDRLADAASAPAPATSSPTLSAAPSARSRARARRCEDTPAMVAHGHAAIAAPRTEGERR